MLGVSDFLIFFAAAAAAAAAATAAAAVLLRTYSRLTILIHVPLVFL